MRPTSTFRPSHISPVHLGHSPINLPEPLHVLARVQHPQANGKIERFFGTPEQKRYFFKNDNNRFMGWYTINTYLS